MFAARSILLLLVSLLLGPGAAHAGEFSEFRPLGFSADGKVFAFEEFGIQDGSGFAFANRFFIDTTRDAFLPGSTVRVVIEDESAGIGAARAEAASKSASREAIHRFSDNPGVIAAFSPASSLDAAAHRLRYTPVSMVPQPFGAYTVRLREEPLPASSLCDVFGQTSTGFGLEMTEINGQPAALLLHQDKAVPRSRGCPVGYRIGGAVTHLSGGVVTQAILVLVRSHGFEGENGRWIAITRRFE
ncbi:DUF2259 domain-containing protein [Hoeflea sp. YIM 152468]|uniref:DUF2259 domain-containing protein n=1 Tax=Hoeflea sp. YIM 152468 TaxID=3031759 RepID=UPI0023DA8C31|nr:DUF2259 domain-containing protein [Hoeflea sp. YIM 152468]MDF1607477.1 DUF2259 domain-containing protein [Hoeflea sp. YIM 152468]